MAYYTAPKPYWQAIFENIAIKIKAEATFILCVDIAYNIVYNEYKEVMKVSNKTSFNVRIDEDLKNEANLFFNGMGLTLTSAINLFIKQALLQGRLPFNPVGDLFYTEKYQKELDAVSNEMKAGKKTEISFAEWERKYDR